MTAYQKKSKTTPAHIWAKNECNIGSWNWNWQEVKGVNYQQDLEGIHSHLKWKELVGFNFFFFLGQNVT